MLFYSSSMYANFPGLTVSYNSKRKSVKSSKSSSIQKAIEITNIEPREHLSLTLKPIKDN